MPSFWQCPTSHHGSLTLPSQLSSIDHRASVPATEKGPGRAEARARGTPPVDLVAHGKPPLNAHQPPAHNIIGGPCCRVRGGAAAAGSSLEAYRQAGHLASHPLHSGQPAAERVCLSACCIGQAIHKSNVCLGEFVAQRQLCES